MATAHRQRMVAAGYAPKHHGRDPRAVKAVEAEEAANQYRQKTASEPPAKTTKTKSK